MKKKRFSVIIKEQMSSRLMVNLIKILDISAKRWRTPERNPIAILDISAKRWQTPEQTDSISGSKRVAYFYEGDMARSADYKYPSFQERIVLQRYLKVLHDAAQFFKTYFIGKVVVYQTADTEVDVYFSASNFMHLCGLSYQKGTHSFFDDCLAQHLDVSQLRIKRDGTTIQKLQALHSIEEIIGPYVRLTGRNRYLYLEFDAALRTNKQILALTLKNDRRKSIPQSLLDLKRQRTFPKGEEVIRIRAIDLRTREITQYSEK